MQISQGDVIHQSVLCRSAKVMLFFKVSFGSQKPQIISNVINEASTILKQLYNSHTSLAFSIFNLLTNNGSSNLFLAWQRILL
jgi:hypothetical protein